MRISNIASRTGAAILLTFATSTLALAGQGGWQVSRVTGDVWVSSAGAQKVSLTSAAQVQAGDSVRTGRNGRVLLVRGEEVIMIAPGSEIAIPESSSDGMATTIVQRIGSATFEVEKRNVQHFKVETPYLAAVVKGTRFQVSVAGSTARVNVTRGAVDVSDFKSGQHALIMPGQVARVSTLGRSGLAISGPGAHSPILQGPPRTPGVAPDSRALRAGQSESKVSARGQEQRANGSPGPKRGELSRVGGNQAHKPSMRISAPVGDIKLNYAKVTRGLASGVDTGAPNGRANGTVWNSSDSKSNPSMTNNSGQSASAAAVASGVGGGTAASASGGGGNGNGGGNGVGNGNANPNSNAGGNGNGNAYGLIGNTVNGVSHGLGKALGHLKK
jgi:hypothetical protein